MQSNLPTNVPVASINGDAILADANQSFAIATAITIDSDEMYQAGAEEVRDIKAKHKALDERRQGMVSGLNKVVKDINDLFRPALERLLQGETAIKNSMIAYQSEQDAKRREAQRIADAAAQVERARLQQEADRLKEQARLSGDNTVASEAEAVQEEIQYVAPARSTIAAPAVKGISTSRPWKCRLPDSTQEKLALIQHIATHLELLNLIEINQAACNALAKAMKENLKVPGLTAYQDTVISSRS